MCIVWLLFKRHLLNSWKCSIFNILVCLLREIPKSLAVGTFFFLNTHFHLMYDFHLLSESQCFVLTMSWFEEKRNEIYRNQQFFSSEQKSVYRSDSVNFSTILLPIKKSNDRGLHVFVLYLYYKLKEPTESSNLLRIQFFLTCQNY